MSNLLNLELSNLIFKDLKGVINLSFTIIYYLIYIASRILDRAAESLQAIELKGNLV